MTLWNWSTEKTKRIYHKLYSLYHYVTLYFHKDFYTWYLFPNTLFPLSYRESFQSHFSSPVWEYNPDQQTLTWKESDTDQKEYQVSWLSASIQSPQKEVEMDTFLSTLRIYLPEKKEKEIPLSLLLQAWSIYSRQWWIQDTTHVVKWIDEWAEEHAIGIHDTCLVPVVATPSSSSNKKN